ncbi:MAG: UDP-N-acetylglucosamine 2-epimerase (non-hydrolyzing) [Clostridiales Family XIII bacterium]|jgi:UDP-N-acetylglucosamine 2-epimerase (non-hydrolysing)|nr:UDP-N-acetylglucosamine 2-epimerase (non-hydrolyzing) [Clostridiales Family XIII bacterium]
MNARKLKLMTIFGTRPEIIKLSEVIKRSKSCFNCVNVFTGQNYDDNLSKIFFKSFNIQNINHFLDVVGLDLGETIGNIISKSYKVLKEESPEALLILGDTNSALSALSAKRLKIPIFHMEAGNRCFDENLPEEINRKIIDHISDVNLCYTEQARRNLLAEGRPTERTLVVGSPMAEIIEKNLENINNSAVLNDLRLINDKYLILSVHREENIDNHYSFNQIIESINLLASEFKYPIIFSVHPRTAKALETKKVKLHKLIKLNKPFNFFDYMALQKSSFCVISDSGTLAEESSFFNFPAVSLRTSTERPEALEKGHFVLSGLTANELICSVYLANNSSKMNYKISRVPDYLDNNVSDKVVKIIQSYFKIIDKVVWNKFF